MFSLLKELWPFLVEIFFKNSQLKKDIKKPSVLGRAFIALFLIFTLLYGMYVLINEVLLNNYRRCQVSQEQMLETDRAFSRKVEEYRILQKDFSDLSIKNHEHKKKIMDLKEEIHELVRVKRILQNDLKLIGDSLKTYKIKDMRNINKNDSINNENTEEDKIPKAYELFRSME